MHYAIIAAGEGSRLRHEGVGCPKPLVPVEGVPMLGRLVRLFASMQAESISVICNDESPEVEAYLRELEREIPMLRHLVQSTPSSMHSFHALSQLLPAGRFCLTTVDTIFLPSQFRRFISEWEGNAEWDGYFAVTPFVDDEKPLWVGVDRSACPGRILGFYDSEEEFPPEVAHYVSGGIYCLHTASALSVLQACLAQGQSRMRNYQRALLAAGLRIGACVFPKIMDIDHLEDVRKAEAWLASESRSARDKGDLSARGEGTL